MDRIDQPIEGTNSFETIYTEHFGLAVDFEGELVLDDEVYYWI